eukprot:31089-Pelagococcus_subviridis.AAC.22
MKPFYIQYDRPRPHARAARDRPNEGAARSSPGRAEARARRARRRHSRSRPPPPPPRPPDLALASSQTDDRARRHAAVVVVVRARARGRARVAAGERARVPPRVAVDARERGRSAEAEESSRVGRSRRGDRRAVRRRDRGAVPPRVADDRGGDRRRRAATARGRVRLREAHRLRRGALPSRSSREKSNAFYNAVRLIHRASLVDPTARRPRARAPSRVPDPVPSSLRRDHRVFILPRRRGQDVSRLRRRLLASLFAEGSGLGAVACARADAGPADRDPGHRALVPHGRRAAADVQREGSLRARHRRGVRVGVSAVENSRANFGRLDVLGDAASDRAQGVLSHTGPRTTAFAW